MKLHLASVLIAAFATTNVASAATSAPSVHIHNFAFVPASLTVSAGTSVTFVNDDAEPHTATALDKTFDSEAIDTNGHWTHTFTTPGSYAYFCELHPMMKGKLIVTAAGR